jgi:hypothetical protein
LDPIDTLKLLRYTLFAQATRSAALSLQPVGRSQIQCSLSKTEIEAVEREPCCCCNHTSQQAEYCKRNIG